MRHTTLALSFSLLLLLACKGKQGDQGPTGLPGASDKQIEFSFGSGFASSDTAWSTTNAFFNVYHFNSDNYVGIDSAVLNAIVGSSDIAVNGPAELFDLTHNLPIAGSALSGHDTTKIAGTITSGSWVGSTNIYTKLPSGDVTLAMRYKSARQGTLVYVSIPTLYLYRK